MSFSSYDDARIRHDELIYSSARHQQTLDYRRAHRLTVRARLADRLRALATRLDRSDSRYRTRARARSVRRLAAR